MFYIDWNYLQLESTGQCCRHIWGSYNIGSPIGFLNVITSDFQDNQDRWGDGSW